MRFKVLSVAAAMTAALALTSVASAAGSLFAVPGIKVEGTGESATKACEAAYGQGSDRAWRKLVERIVPKASWGSVPDPDKKMLEDLVQGFAPGEESRSTTKCTVTMTYMFRPDLTKKYLREHGVTYADRRGPATIAIPLYETAEGTRLWGDDNLWLGAYRRVKLENELVPVEAPYGDDGDKAAIPSGASLGTEWSTYKTIADKYGVKAVLVARAKYDGATVSIEADHVTEHGSQHYSVTGNGDGDERAALDDAVRNLAAVMGESWKTTAAIDNSMSASLSVWAPYNSLAQRNDIEKRLRRVQNVLTLSINRVTTSGMSIWLKYRGRKEQFQEALRDAGFGIYRGSSGPVLDSYRPGEPMALEGKATSDSDDSQPAVEPPVEEPQVIRPQ